MPTRNEMLVIRGVRRHQGQSYVITWVDFDGVPTGASDLGDQMAASIDRSLRHDDGHRIPILGGFF